MPSWTQDVKDIKKAQKQTSSMQKPVCDVSEYNDEVIIYSALVLHL